ncbi:MAG TPA: phage holin family protein [Solirubrobacteraceae bacterium]|nr:phage holin family protein [Solirubrobacteraceae bacterium]
MARRLALTWAFNTCALFVACWLLAGLSYGADWWALLGAGLVFTLVNAYVRPVLAFLSIPLIVASLGVFYLLINVLMLYLTHWLVAQFAIAGFWWAVLAALIVSVVNGVLHVLFGRPRGRGARVAAGAVWL